MELAILGLRRPARICSHAHRNSTRRACGASGTSKESWHRRCCQVSQSRLTISHARRSFTASRISEN